jgi:uncharacterized membrane protein YjfL (UPF0719 family)
MKKLGMCGALLVLAASQASAQTPPPGNDLGQSILHWFLWLGVAAVAFVLAFKVVDWTTPGDLRQQLVEGNTALAIYVGSLAIAIAIIISRA